MSRGEEAALSSFVCSLVNAANLDNLSLPRAHSNGTNTPASQYWFPPASTYATSAADPAGMSTWPWRSCATLIGRPNPSFVATTCNIWQACILSAGQAIMLSVHLAHLAPSCLLARQNGHLLLQLSGLELPLQTACFGPILRRARQGRDYNVIAPVRSCRSK